MTWHLKCSQLPRFRGARGSQRPIPRGAGVLSSATIACPFRRHCFQHQRRVAARTAEELAALSAAAHQEALEREELLVGKLSDAALKTRLAALGAYPCCCSFTRHNHRSHAATLPGLHLLCQSGHHHVPELRPHPRRAPVLCASTYACLVTRAPAFILATVRPCLPPSPQATPRPTCPRTWPPSGGCAPRAWCVSGRKRCHSRCARRHATHAPGRASSWCPSVGACARTRVVPSCTAG